MTDGTLWVIAAVAALFTLVFWSAASMNVDERVAADHRARQATADSIATAAWRARLDSVPAYESRPAPTASTTGRVPSGAGAPAGYQATRANLYIGDRLYLKSTLEYVGEVVDYRSDHRFPDGTERDGVLVSYATGAADVLPREAVHLLYWKKD